MNILTILIDALVRRGLLSSDACVKELSQLIKDGQLAVAFKTDPVATTACLCHTLATLVIAVSSRFHDHSDESQSSPRFGLMRSSAHDQAVVTPAATVAELLKLADALGVELPKGGPIEGPLVALILQQLLAYIVANLPELIEQLIDQLSNEPKPTIGETQSQ